ncbi:hypothetical protein C2S51_009692 [Perilla frutescens var. frutescens]|nr:hypothetical protein C2S51_009692 [Perilla frutescens var. frutescens]
MNTIYPGLPLLLILPLLFPAISGQTDIINADQTIRDGETLVSSFGKFALGFFSPRNSNNRYVGMWFNNITEITIVWVANRESPITDNAGVLKLIHPGILILLNGTNGTVWASNATATAPQNPVAQLLDTGNLVVRDGGDDSPENFLWQSFEHPTDTYLPGMNLGWNLVTGKENYLSSWKSHDDPATGEFSFHLDPTGYPQIVIKRGSAIQSRNGPWNGIRFPGPPNPREDPTYRLTFEMDAEKVYYRSDLVDRSFVSRYTLNQSGVSQRWTWVDRTRGWVIYFSTPADICDTYNLCGPYGSCNVAGSPSCGCLDTRFVARDPEGWVRADWSNGCVRRSNLSCEGDVFLKYSGIKLPDARDSWHDSTMTMDECEVECLRNCSCTAYSQLDVRNKSGCLIWYGELVDMRVMSDDGQVIYIRMAASEADVAESDEGKKKRVALVASLVSVMGVVLLVLGLSLYMWRRKRKNFKMMGEEGKCTGGDDNHSDLPFWDLSVILKATNYFSSDNKLGEGGFGPVYKGKLEGGQEIAVKRLSKESRQGLNELKNEVIFIAKLQHRNLVKLLGCCIKGEESILIYEYLPNKSLDVILFVCIYEYVVGLVDEDREWRVTFDPITKKISCTCRRFEMIGLLCCHAVKVYDVMGVKKLPEHYILKRWTREAKHGMVVQDCMGNEVEEDPKLQSTERYRKLCTMLTRLAIEASIHSSTFSLVHEVVHDLSKQVMEIRLTEESQEKSSCADISPTVASMTQSKGFKKKIGAKRTRRLKSWVELQSKRRKTNPRVKDFGAHNELLGSCSPPHTCLQTTGNPFNFTEFLMAPLDHPSYSLEGMNFDGDASNVKNQNRRSSLS